MPADPEEWMQLLPIVNGRRISIKWNHFPRHKGISGNEEADKQAEKEATNQGINLKRTDANRVDN